MSHTRSHSQANNQRAQLANAYQELGKELGREKLKVVGGYTLGRKIGEGTYGLVYIATHRLTATRCAIKKIPKTLTSQLTREIHHHRLLHHPNILHLHEVVATETHIWLVSELCTGGELFDYLVERGRLLEGEGRRIFGELTVAVGLLHKKGTVHRDLKLENILLDGECRVKLGDLGFAREWARGQKMLETFCGTTGYASPEVLKGQKYNGEEADIWSLGIILYTLLCGGLPFDDDDEEAMKELIYKAEYDEPDWLSQEAGHLIKSLLQLEPSKRMPIKGILTHPWFNKRIVDPPLNSIAGAHELAPDSPYLHSPNPPEVPQFFGQPAEGGVAAKKIRSQTEPGSVALPPPESGVNSRGISPLSSPKVHLIGADKDLNTAPPPIVIFNSFPPSESDGAASESSFDFLDSEKGRNSSVSTSPTTADGGELEMPALPEAFTSGKEDMQLPSPIMSHSNSSESTIRRSDDALNRGAGRPNTTGKSRVSVLAHQPEEDETDDVGILPTTGPSLAPEESHVHLPVAARSRTPSRTKRRSMSSLPDTRPGLGSHLSWSAQVLPLVDYLGQLESTAAPYFSTRAEKEILGSLDMLGFDIGQLKHSVSTNACDPSAALWWILRLKQHLKAEAERDALAALPLEPVLAKVKKSKSRTMKAEQEEAGEVQRPSQGRPSHPAQLPQPGGRGDDLVELAEPVQLDPPRRPSISPDSRAHTVADPTQLPRQVISGQNTLPVGSLSSPDIRLNNPARSPSPPEQRFLAEASRSVDKVAPSPPPPPPFPSPRATKGRAASFTMLQRATTALAGAGLTRKKSDDKLLDISKGKQPEMISPNKLHKSPSSVGKPGQKDIAGAGRGYPIAHGDARIGQADQTGEQADNLLVPSRTLESFASTSSSGVSLAASTPSKRSKENNGKRDGGLLTTFKSWFEMDKRKRRRDGDSVPVHAAPRPTSVYGGTPGLRSQHVHAIRKTTTVMTKRMPSDGRPALHSRRSSSANSRRSSVASTHILGNEGVATNPDGNHALSRRQSHRSAGSRTPTSEHDYGSRPSSVRSFHLHAQGPSTVLHQANSGPASSAVGMSSHGGTAQGLQRGQHLFPSTANSGRSRTGRRSTGPHGQRRTASGASSRHSESSKRSSGPEFEPDLAEEPEESEGDASYDDAGSTHSRQRRRSSDSHHTPLQPSIIVASRRMRSPRVTQLLVDQRRRQSDERIAHAHVQPRAPLRDVFAGAADDDWISDEEQAGGFSGGLGQLCSGAGERILPTPTDSPTASNLPGGKIASTATIRGRVTRPVPQSSLDASTGRASTVQPDANVGIVVEVPGRRGGRVPMSIGRPADIREEDEEEEET